MSRASLAAFALALATVGAAACGGETKPPAQSATTTTTSARADSNKAVVARALEEIWAQKNPDAVSKFYAKDLVNHAAIPEAQGAAGMRDIVAKLLVAFPDLTMHVSGIATGDDDVIVRVVMEGTHTGLLDFKKPLAATNKHFKIDQVITCRVKDGLIVESWMVMDRMDLLGQLGVVPGAGKAPPP